MLVQWLINTLVKRVIPPSNVRAVYQDGTVIPLEMAYQGKVNGFHHWVATALVQPEDGVCEFRADFIPAHSSIEVRVVRKPPHYR